jgi:hypothetical protein
MVRWHCIEDERLSEVGRSCSSDLQVSQPDLTLLINADPKSPKGRTCVDRDIRDYCCTVTSYRLHHRSDELHIYFQRDLTLYPILPRYPVSQNVPRSRDQPRRHRTRLDPNLPPRRPHPTCITPAYINTSTASINGLSSYPEETPSMLGLQEVYPERVGEV